MSYIFTEHLYSERETTSQPRRHSMRFSTFSNIWYEKSGLWGTHGIISAGFECDVTRCLCPLTSSCFCPLLTRTAVNACSCMFSSCECLPHIFTYPGGGGMALNTKVWRDGLIKWAECLSTLVKSCARQKSGFKKIKHCPFNPSIHSSKRGTGLYFSIYCGQGRDTL